jgi:ABC-type transporter lipoprotein component MlaA
VYFILYNECPRAVREALLRLCTSAGHPSSVQPTALNANSTRCSQEVARLSINRVQGCLAAVLNRPEHSGICH